MRPIPPFINDINRLFGENQIDRAVKKIENPDALNKPSQNDPKRFMKATHVTQDGEVANKTQAVLNQEQIDKESAYDGFYAICTNLESPIEEIITQKI